MPAKDIFPGTFFIFPSKNISDLRSQKSLSNLGLDKAYEYFFGTKKCDRVGDNYANMEMEWNRGLRTKASEFYP